MDDYLRPRQICHITNIIIIMQKGTVKFFNNAKGFGFIKDDGSGVETFVHVTGLIDEVRDGDAVTYEVVNGKKGQNAVNVKLAH